MTFEILREEILEILGAGVDGPLSDARFNELALRVFRFQCRQNKPYGGFVSRRGVDPEEVDSWEEIPHLPTRAFKKAVLVSGDPNRTEKVFRTSGTTLGLGGRGEHHVRDLALYRASLLPNFGAHLLPGVPGRIRMLCLLASPQDAPDSSLSFMMGEAVEQWGEEGSGFLWDPARGTASEALLAALEEAGTRGEPVLVAGTAFAFAHWVMAAGEEGWRTPLPEGSRIMETGGFKGRSVELPRADLYGGLEEFLGVPSDLIVNEYGMTELLSQFYEPVLDGESAGLLDEAVPSRAAPLSHRYHRGPPWVRTRVLHPLTLTPLPPGEVGILAHMDLANLGSVSAVLTEDLGRKTPGGFRLQGRSPGSEPRGCSLAMEDFLAARGRGI